MDRSISFRSEICPLIRRLFLCLWLVSFWPYALVAGCMIFIAPVVHARAASGPTFNPTNIWSSMSLLAKFALFIVFASQTFLPRDLGAVGVAMIVRSDQLGENLNLKSFVSRYARIVWIVAPLSVCLGTMILLGSAFVLPGLIFGIWSAFVMPALGSAQDELATAIRRSFRLTVPRRASLIGLEMGTAIALIPALLALYVPILMAADGQKWWVGQLVGWSLFAGLVGVISMTRSVVLTLLYLDSLGSEKAARMPLLQ